MAVLSGAPLSSEVKSSHSFTPLTHLGLFAGWAKTAMLHRLCKSYSLQCRDVFWGKQKLPWLHTIFDFITQVDWREQKLQHLEQVQGRRRRWEKGRGEKYFSVPNASPAPYESPHCLDYFRIQHCGIHKKRQSHTKRKCTEHRLHKNVLRFESDGDVLCA